MLRHISADYIGDFAHDDIMKEYDVADFTIHSASHAAELGFQGCRVICRSIHEDDYIIYYT